MHLNIILNHLQERNFIRHFTSQSNPKAGTSLSVVNMDSLEVYARFLIFFLDPINFSVPTRLTYYDVTLSFYSSSSCILRVTDR